MSPFFANKFWVYFYIFLSFSIFFLHIEAQEAKETRRKDKKFYQCFPFLKNSLPSPLKNCLILLCKIFLNMESVICDIADLEFVSQKEGNPKIAIIPCEYAELFKTVTKCSSFSVSMTTFMAITKGIPSCNIF